MDGRPNCRNKISYEILPAQCKDVAAIVIRSDHLNSSHHIYPVVFLPAPCSRGFELLQCAPSCDLSLCQTTKTHSPAQLESLGISAEI